MKGVPKRGSGERKLANESEMKVKNVEPIEIWQYIKMLKGHM